MMTKIGAPLTFLVAIACCSLPAEAGVMKNVLKGVKHLSRELMGESVEAAGKKATKAGLHSADNVARAAARNGSAAVRTFSRFGDDVVRAAEKLSPQNSRRLMMLMPELERTGKSAEVMQLIAKGGKADQVVDFLFRHRGALLGGAAVTSLLVNPEETLAAVTDVTVGLANVAGSHIAEPLITSVSEDVLHPVASETATAIAWPLQMLAWGVAALLAMRFSWFVAGRVVNSPAHPEK